MDQTTNTKDNSQEPEQPEHRSGLPGLFTHTRRIVALVIGVLFVAGVVVYQVGLRRGIFVGGENPAGGPGVPAAVITQEFVVGDNGITYDSKASIDKNPDALPTQDHFKEFSYDPNVGKIIALEGRCTDTYYAVIIFKNTVNYKNDPAGAAFNTAFPCPASHTFRNPIDLRAYPLTAGSYYFFVADQGKSGSWYNPR